MAKSLKLFPKAATGIQGLDEILDGGLPKGRPTLLCGTAGSGKTLLAMEFLVRGAVLFDEPGVFVTFGEGGDGLAKDAASLGFDLPALIGDRKLQVEYVHTAHEEALETGLYDQESMYARLGQAIDSIGAKRVVFDMMESPYFALPASHTLHNGLRRFLRRLRDKVVTVMITAGEGALAQHGQGEYISDCVIRLDQRIMDQFLTRRLRVIRYRGSAYGADEYPYLIDEHGIVVMPISTMGLHYAASTERISSGIPRLDTMLKGGGFYRGSTLLVSGTTGSGKTTVAAHFVEAACRRGEQVLGFSFEESPGQITRNMHSVGIELGFWVKKGLLHIEAARPLMCSLEARLATMYRHIERFQPEIVIVDPINALVDIDNQFEVRSLLMRLVDYLRGKGITIMFTSLTVDGSAPEHTDATISPFIDTWLQLINKEGNGERNRGMYILKSRGMAHSNQVREFLITDQGIQLMDVYLGPGGMLTGSARLEQEAREKAERMARWQETERRQRELERKRHALEVQITALRGSFSNEEAELMQAIAQEQLQEVRLLQGRLEMAKSRHADQDQQGGILSEEI